MVVLLGVVLGFGIYWGVNLNRNLETFWARFAAKDSAAIADAADEDFWDCIEKECGYTEAECIGGLDLYFEELERDLGAPLSYAVTDVANVTFGGSDSAGVEYIEPYMTSFGVDYTFAIGIDADITLSGSTSSRDYTAIPMWIYRKDGAWHDFTAMRLIYDTICAEGYAEDIRSQSLYGDVITAYWNAFYNHDIDALAQQMPSGAWEIIEASFSLDQSAAEICMGAYCDGILQTFSLEGTACGFAARVTDVADLDDQDVDDVLGAAVPVDSYKEVSFDYTLTVDGKPYESASSSSILMQSGGTWYIFDGLYYFIEACYNYSGE